ncbi:MAG: O-antigen ligase domain-containing protein [Hyphomicrobiales bacterium]|nr:O-antigen ligase domain-containing protein [Hyphomicrobiales bacterium]
MTASAVTEGAVAGPRIATEKLRAILLWLFAFSGGFVVIEPGPYEVIGSLALLMFAATGLVLRPALAPLILLLTVLNLGYALSLFRVNASTPSVIWVLVSVFLSLTAIFFAAVVTTNTEARLRWLLRGYVAAAVVVSLFAIGGYFELFGAMSGRFVVHARAAGTFKDPNVFAAFLVLPGLLILQRMLGGGRSEFLSGGVLLLIVSGGLFLSFSRAAWGQFVFCALLLMLLSFLSSRSARRRLRIVIIAVAGAAIALAFLAVLLSLDQVAALFKERASLMQSYDAGHVGRFGRYLIAMTMMLDYPFGMGPLQFAFPEAPHNTYLNSFIVGGGLSGTAYLTLTLVTLTAGLRVAFIRTRWQATYQAIYVALVGIAAESVIIDSDHWRHYYLILGVLWGLIAVARSSAEARNATAPPTLVAPAAISNPPSARWDRQ